MLALYETNNAAALGTSHRVMRRQARRPKTCTRPFVAAIARSADHYQQQRQGEIAVQGISRVKHVYAYVVGERKVFAYQQT